MQPPVDAKEIALWIAAVVVAVLVTSVCHWRRRALAAEKVIGLGDRLRYWLLVKVDERNQELQAAKERANRTVVEALREDHKPAKRRAS